MSESVASVLREINLRLERIEYALIPPERVDPEEAEELNALYEDARSGNVVSWRDLKRGE